jgi:hypothetical protein
VIFFSISVVKCTFETKSRVPMARVAFNKKRAFLLAKWTWN